MRVTKMHGIGNDYVYVNGFEEKIDQPARLARKLSDRHFGVGGDGLIIIQPPTSTGLAAGAACRMEMYNADGSRAQMCGNGIRCVAKYAHDHGIASGTALRIETDAGLRLLEIRPEGSRQPSSPPNRLMGGGATSLVTVDMGGPRLAPREIPARWGGEQPVVDAPLEVPELGKVQVTLLSMGNPHCVVRLGGQQPLPAAVADLNLEKIGPLFENHPAFPERINTEFVAVKSPREIEFRVWERGSGETMACGTGACAAVVAGVLGGWGEREATVHLRGGDLSIRWDAATGKVFMTGPATEVFTAELGDDWLRENLQS